MSFFLKLIDESQITKPPEATRHHNSEELLILLPLRAHLFCILHYETPCKYQGHKYINSTGSSINDIVSFFMTL